MAYQIITDATADMDARCLEGLPGIEIIPMRVRAEDREYSYGPEGDLTPEQFYQLQRNGAFASTTQINLETYRAVFDKFLCQGVDVLYLCFSSGMSGCCQSANICAGELRAQYPQRKLTVIDTLCASIGEGLLVLEAARKQAAGYSIEELEQWVYDSRMNCTHWFTVDTLTHLKQGGRVSAATAAVGTMLNIKPFLRLSDSGGLEVIGKPRGRKKANEEMLAKLDEGWMPQMSRTVIVGHGGCPEEAEALKTAVRQRHPEAEVFIAYIGPVIGAHTGPGMLALVYWGNNR